MQQKPRIKKKYSVSFKSTFENLKKAIDNLRIITPPEEEGGPATIKEGIKQSVYSTLTEIYRLYLLNHKKGEKRASTALSTKINSLCRVLHASERTVRRHINKLIGLGLIQAKNRLTKGIQLVLNASILAFDEVKVILPPLPPEEPATSPITALDLPSLAQAIRSKFLIPGAPGRSS